MQPTTLRQISADTNQLSKQYEYITFALHLHNLLRNAVVNTKTVDSDKFILKVWYLVLDLKKQHF